MNGQHRWRCDTPTGVWFAPSGRRGAAFALICPGSDTTPGMPTPEERLSQLGLSLPEPPKPVAAYIPSRRTGNLLFVSGQIPAKDGQLIARGSVPSQVSMDAARDCARQCVLNG